MSLSWDGMFAYAFPPFHFLLQVLLKIKQSDCKIILIAPAWPRQALLDLEKHLKKKVEWRKGVSEHSVPRERHGVYCEGQRVWNWRYKGFRQASETSFQTRSSVSVQGKSGTSKARVSSSSRLATL
jgi:hypothetical protein